MMCIGISLVALATGAALSAQIAKPSAMKPVAPAKPLSQVVKTLTPASAEQASAFAGRATGWQVLRSPHAGRGVLSSFKLAYSRSDHMINRFGILLAGSRAEFSLFDRDGNDPFRGEATWLQSPSFGATQQISAVAAGDVVLDLPRGPAGHVALLQGFQFERKEQTDANVRLVAVQIAEDSGTVRVALVDDQGADFRGMDGAVVGAVNVVPFGSVISPILFGTRATGTFPQFDEKRQRTYRITVQYVWVPRGAIKQTGMVSGNSRMSDSGTLPGPNDKVGLRGFRMLFTNSDHFLRGIGVNFVGDPRQPPIVYQDNDVDDPVAWNVTWAKLN